MSSLGNKLLVLAAAAACIALPMGAQQPPKVELLTAYRLGTTPPMREYLLTHHVAPNAPYRVFPLRKPGSKPGKGGGGGGSTFTDPVLQTSEGSTTIAGVTASFDGVSSVGYVPPDTNISVGPDQVVETVNVDFAVYGKAGNPVMGPAPIHSIFAAASGGNLSSSDPCASTDGGDPIVLYDKLDGRWIISQLAFNKSFTKNEFCVAISTSNDASGSYAAYDLPFGSNLPDYPKLGVWVDGSWKSPGATSGVYFSANMFAHGSSFIGAQMCAFPLSEVGQVTDASAPSGLNWVCAQNGTNVFSILPADLEGVPGLGGSTNPAPADTPEYFVQFSGNSTLNVYSFQPDFNAGTASVSNLPDVTVAQFREACGGGACVPQLNTSEQLDSLGDRLMYRLSYRNYDTVQRMVVTQSVQNSSAGNQTGIRWYQLDNTGSGWSVGQQGTFGPNDGLYRWMGSIAQDKVGDLAVGYSTSSASSYPGIAYTGRTTSDPANTLESEQFLSIGAGAQKSVNRWGDYSSMSVDPANDCTFWYANEYLLYTGSYNNWTTRILSFQFPGCK